MNTNIDARVTGTEAITRRLEREKRIAARNGRKKDQYRPMTKTELTRYMKDVHTDA
jgi:hypothetical protein